MRVDHFTHSAAMEGLREAVAYGVTPCSPANGRANRELQVARAKGRDSAGAWNSS